MIICPSCGTENQEHFRFCQGCGLDISNAPRGRVNAAAVPLKTETTVEAQVETPAAEAPSEAPPEALHTPPAPMVVARPAHVEPAASSHVCAVCSYENTTGNVFCGGCGTRMPPPVAAAPAAPAAPDAALAPTAVPAFAHAPSLAPVASAADFVHDRALDRTSLGGISPLAAPAKSVRFSLTLLRVDGTDAGVFSSTESVVTVGRQTGGVFSSDATLSPLHAKFDYRGGGLFVTDCASLNGVYRRLVRNVPALLEHLEGFRIGQEILRYEVVRDGDVGNEVRTLGSPRHGVAARIVSIVGRGDYGNAFSIPPTGLLFGRERGHVLFPEDGYVSGLHCRIHHEGMSAFLTDLGSSNGTYIRLRAETEVGAGDVLLMGQQLFRVGLA